MLNEKVKNDKPQQQSDCSYSKEYPQVEETLRNRYQL